MKIYNIFKKNLKTVSRSWSYFFVLMVCPAILIIAAGGMLNSFAPENIHVGIFDEAGIQCQSSGSTEPQDSLLGPGLFENIDCYHSLRGCLEALSSSEIAVCLHVQEEESFYQLDVYLDNSRKIVEYYAKQMIMSKVLGTQTEFIEDTSADISSNILLYSSAIIDAKNELINTQQELENQKIILADRREKLRQIKSDFDTVYVPLKSMEPQLVYLRNQVQTNQQNLEGNISYFRSKKTEMESSINSLKSFLSTRLNSGDYAYSSSTLDSLSQNLDEIDLALSNVEALYNNQDLIESINIISSIIPKLDSINEALIETDKDLGDAIIKIDESKIKIGEYIVKLDAAYADLNSFNKEVNTKALSLRFRESSENSSDPILLSYPLLIGIIICFTSLILSNLFVLRQINKPSYFRELISPTRDISFVTADYLLNLFFIAVQAAVLFVIGYYWIGVPSSTLLPFSAVIFVASSFFIFVGMSLGYVIKSQSLSMLLTIFLVILFLILSDLIVPVPLLSPSIRFIIELNPFVIFSNLLKDIFILNMTLNEELVRLVIFVVFLFLAFGLVFLSRRINRERVRE